MSDTTAAVEIVWLPDQQEKTFSDYECPVCHGIERMSSFIDGPPMHRHRYGTDPLQTGAVIRRRVQP
jgi:hypothetical protein